MSQQQFFGEGSLPPPPVLVETLTGDSGVATAAANNINVPGGTSSINNVNGVQTVGSGDTLTVQLTNRVQGTLTTNNASPQDLISFNLGAIPGVYTFQGSVAGYIPATGDAGGYFFEGTLTTNGTVADFVGGQFSSFQETSGFNNVQVTITDSGNDFIVQVEGIAATTINWNSLFNYLKVT